MRWVAWPHSWIYCHVSSIPWPRWHACWKWAARWSCKPYRSGGPGGWRSKKYEKDMQLGTWSWKAQDKKCVLKLRIEAGGCVYVLFRKHSCSSSWIRQDSSPLDVWNFCFHWLTAIKFATKSPPGHGPPHGSANGHHGAWAFNVLLKPRTPDEPNEMLPDKSIQILLLSFVIVCLGLDLLGNEQPGGAFLEPAC